MQHGRAELGGFQRIMASASIVAKAPPDAGYGAQTVKKAQFSQCVGDINISVSGGEYFMLAPTFCLYMARGQHMLDHGTAFGMARRDNG